MKEKKIKGKTQQKRERTYTKNLKQAEFDEKQKT